jgi:nucleotide-binding universal stress UspA family protein
MMEQRDYRIERRGRDLAPNRLVQHNWPPVSGIHDIAVHIEDTEWGEARLAIARDIALSHRAALHGIGIPEADDQPQGPSVLSETGSALFPLNALVDCPTLLAPALDEDSRATAWTARREAIERWYKDRMSQTPQIVCDWHNVPHGSLEQMVGIAKMSDLTIFGPHHPPLSLEISPGIAPEDIALESGRPVLIVPSNVSTMAVGVSALIAWDGSREAVRALYDALPLCRSAGRIVLLHIKESSEAPRPDFPGVEGGMTILARHGFHAETEIQDAEHASVVGAVLDKAARIGADLIVAGLPHHSRLRDTLFGSVCRDLIRKSPISVLIAH